MQGSANRNVRTYMDILYNRIFKLHETGQHPEGARRMTPFEVLPDCDLLNGEELLGLVHRRDYIENIKEACHWGGHLDGDTVVGRQSYEVACYGVGAALLAADRNAFAIIRPPGHHAYPARASGFCLFNNIAIAVQYLVEQGKRVCIIDFDGHLGDGTAFFFYPTDKVLFWSLHQYPAFPGNGFIEEIGEGRGKGFTLHNPLPPGSADDIFLDAFGHYLPVVEQFEPDIIAVSAGFDAHQFDPLLQLNLSNQAYYVMGRLLGERFARLFAVLEGGYNPEAMSQSLFNFVAGINGHEPPFPSAHTASGMRVWEMYESYLHAGMAKLLPYWKF